MNKTAESITPSELNQLADLKQKHTMLALRAEKNIAEAQLAEQVHNNAVYKLFIKYNLTEKDRINENNGAIIRETINEEANNDE